MLSKIGSSEKAGLRWQIVGSKGRRAFERVVEETPEVAVNEELMTHQRYEAAEMLLETAAQLQVAEE